MAPSALSRSRVSGDAMRSQEERLRRLQESRSAFSALSRSKADAYRKTRTKEAEEEIFKQQIQEMHQVKLRLHHLRCEYDKVCRERGKAHQSAQLVRMQEQEMAEFERRQNEMVRLRAEKVAQKEAALHRKKLAEKNRNKTEQLNRRKTVFQTDWSPQPDPLRWKDKRTFARELEHLITLEKTIEQKVMEKMIKKKLQKQQQIVPVRQSNVSKPAAGKDCCTKRSESVCSCSPSSCSCSGSATPDSELGSVICLDEIARRVYSKLDQWKRLEEGQRRPESRQPARAVPAANRRKSFRETGINTTASLEQELDQEKDQRQPFCSSPSATSVSSGRRSPLTERQMRDFMQQLDKELSAIERPHEQEQSSTRPSDIPKENLVTEPKRLVDSDPTAHRERTLVRDRSFDSVDSLPKLPSFDRSHFWKDVFNTAGISMTETIAQVLQEAKRITQSVEKSLTLLSISGDDELGDVTGNRSPVATSAVTSPLKRL